MKEFARLLLPLLLTWGCQPDVTIITQPAEFVPTSSAAAEGTEPRIERQAIAPLQAYSPCDTNEQCGDLSCVQLLGASVCVAAGCAADPEICVPGETCVVSEHIEPAGVCALTGSSDFCGRNCRDYLVCSLSVECVDHGCCGLRTDDGCALACEMLSSLECEIDPRCGPECCG